MNGQLSRKLDIIASLAMIIASILLIAVSVIALTGGRGRGAPPPFENVESQNLTLSLVDVPVMGTVSSGIVLIEFSNFECPFCRRFESQTFERVKSALVDTGRAAYAYKHLPLPRIH